MTQSQPVIPRFNVLGVRISAMDMTEACTAVESLIKNKEKGYVCVCPVSTIMECVHDAAVMRVVNNATLVTPDGMPTVWIGKTRGFKNMDRVYGPDLMLEICRISSSKGYRHFFYGATAEVLEKLEAALKKRFPGLEICGKFAPPFRPLTKDEDEKIVGLINAAKPDCLWVGLGSPKQDLWIDAHRAVLEVPVMLAVGAAFDFHAGTKPQAPRWMQRTGFEWLFRLGTEPRRLWRRYLMGNSEFLYLLLKESWHKRSGK